MELVDYDPFGVNTIYQKPQGDVYTGKYFYTGQEWDTWTRLYYYGARYYFNEVGSFYSVDPAGFWPEYQQRILGNPQGWNSYAYVMNNPVRLVDPTGECPQCLTPDTYFDLGMLGWDGLRGLKNFVEIATSGGIYAYGYLTDDEALMEVSLQDIEGDIEDLKEVRADIICDSIALAVPVLPAGGTKLARMGVRIENTLQLVGTYSAKYVQRLQDMYSLFHKSSIAIGEHALNSIIKKGFPVDKVIDVYKTGVKYMDAKYGNINYIKDGIRVSVDNETGKITNVLDITSILKERFTKIE